MDSNRNLCAYRPTRGTILCTEEQIPGSASLVSRQMIIEISEGDVDFSTLTEFQATARDGVFAQVKAAYIQWIAPRYEAVQRTKRAKVDAIRDAITIKFSRKRTRTDAAECIFAFHLFLDFALDSAAINQEEHDRHRQESYDSILEIACDQEFHQQNADPVRQFIGLLLSSLTSGAAHLVSSLDETEPAENSTALGWRREASGSSAGAVMRPRGTEIGWVNGDSIFLEPEASYTTLAGLARQQGGSLLPQAPLRKLLYEDGISITTGAKNRNLDRRNVGVIRSRKYVLHVKMFSISARLTHDVSEASEPNREWYDNEVQDAQF